MVRQALACKECGALVMVRYWDRHLRQHVGSLSHEIAGRWYDISPIGHDGEPDASEYEEDD